MDLQTLTYEKAVEMAQEKANKNKQVVYVLELEQGKFIPATICHSVEKCRKRVVPSF